MMVLNFFGGAGIGKSTIAAEVFAKLKCKGVDAELVGEAAKEAILQQDFTMLSDQLWLFANQAHRLRGMSRSGTEVAICDSPLLLNICYGEARNDLNDAFIKLIWHEYNQYKNINYNIIRQKDFWKAANRVDDEKFAIDIDNKINAMLNGEDITRITPYQGDTVVKDVLNILGKEDA